jgi:hypothetical protein
MKPRYPNQRTWGGFLLQSAILLSVALPAVIWTGYNASLRADEGDGPAPVPSLHIRETAYESRLKAALTVELCLGDALEVSQGEDMRDLAWASCRLAARLPGGVPMYRECSKSAWEEKILAAQQAERVETGAIRRGSLATALVVISCPQEAP